MKDKRRVLILNADQTPLGTISWQRAMYLIYGGGNVTPIVFYKDSILGACGKHYPSPAVIATNKYIKRTRIPFSKKNIFIRDGATCQYCGFFDGKQDNLTLDHVVPRSRWVKLKYAGSPTNWENIVTACYKCNHTKGNKTPKEAKITLLKTPQEPSPYNTNYIATVSPWSVVPKEWWGYLPPLYKQLATESPTPPKNTGEKKSRAH